MEVVGEVDYIHYTVSVTTRMPPALRRAAIPGWFACI